MALLLAGRQPNIRMPDGEAEADQALANKGAAVPCRSAPLSATHLNGPPKDEAESFFTVIYPLFCSARGNGQDTVFCQFGKIEYAAIVDRLGKQSRHAECERD
jgi:hypothetical protein